MPDQLPGLDLPACRLSLSPGETGIDETISRMAQMAMGDFGAGSMRIRDLALRIVRDAGAAERDQVAEVRAIHEWVKAHLRYAFDPVGVELVTYPETLAFVRADGDCDDHVVLEAALLGALGIRTRFVVVGFAPERVFSHVYMQAQLRTVPNQPWMSLDPIVKTRPAGWETDKAKVRKVYGLNTADGFTDHGALLGVGLAALCWLLLRRRRVVRSQ